MTRARLHVTVPDGVWKGDVSRRYPETTIRVCATVLDDDAGVELVAVSGPDVEECRSAVESHPDVTDVSTVDRTGTETTVQVESTRSPILRAGSESGTPVETPFEIVNGEATIEVRSTHDGLSALGDRFRALDLEFEVGCVQRESEPRELLTTTQRELLLTAVEEGYYETPRRCTLTELAGSVGVAKSTCSDTLKRAEAAVVDYFLRNADVPAQVGSRPDSTKIPGPGGTPATRRAIGESGTK